MKKRFGTVLAAVFAVFLTACAEREIDMGEAVEVSEFAWNAVLRDYPNGVLANRNGKKIRTQIVTYQFTEGTRIFFCTNRQKPLYLQLINYPYVSFCTYTDNYEPVASFNGNVVFTDDAGYKNRALEGSANVRKFYADAANPDFTMFYIDVSEVETFDSSGAGIYRVKKTDGAKLKTTS